MAIKRSRDPAEQYKGTVYEHLYMRRQDTVYPLSDTEMGMLALVTGVTSVTGSLASFLLTAALSCGLAWMQMPVDANPITLARLFLGSILLLVFGVVFGIIAIVAWRHRRTLLQQIKNQCVPIPTT